MIEELRNWDIRAIELKERLDYLEDRLFSEYVPCHDQPPFSVRLNRWLNGTEDEEDRKRLHSLLDHLYFIGRNELDVLYKEAFRAEAMWWLAPANTKLGSPDFAEAIQRAVNETWFCPITDSMNIAHFHHVNGIRGKDLRPSWRALEALGDATRIRSYMEAKKLHRVVLLEDFVGTGNQVSPAISFALEVLPDIDVLVLPLVICQEGVERLTEITASGGGRAQLRCGLVVPDVCTLGPEEREGEPDDFPALRDLLLRLDSQVEAPGDTPLIRSLGFGALGAMTVMHTNCPNNVPPALHHDDSATWSALFPRSVRLSV